MLRLCNIKRIFVTLYNHTIIDKFYLMIILQYIYK